MSTSQNGIDRTVVRIGQIEGNRLIALVAAVSIFYYLIAFGFEVGFFWESSLELIPVFTIGEHIAHAATYLIQVTIVAFTLLFILYVQGSAQFYLERATGVPQEKLNIVPVNIIKAFPKPIWKKILIPLGLAPLIITIVWELATDLIPRVYRNFDPEEMCIFFGVVAVAGNVIEQALNMTIRWSRLPFVLCGIFASPALGEFQYRNLISKPSQVTIFGSTENKTASGILIFSGLTKSLIKSGGYVCLQDYELKSALAIRIATDPKAAIVSPKCALDTKRPGQVTKEVTSQPQSPPLKNAQSSTRVNLKKHLAV